MNKRIKELADQAGIFYYRKGKLQTDMEKFTELIVKECVGIANKQFSVASGVDNRDCWTALEIKKRFGIEK